MTPASAIDLAISALKAHQRKNYTAGEAAYQKGIRGLSFAENGHKHFVEYDDAMRVLEGMKPRQPELFPQPSLDRAPE